MNAGLILARLDSKRFPKKATTLLGKKKLIEWCIEGVKKTSNLEPIVVTTDRAVDLPLIEIAKENNIRFYQGDFEDVSKRIAQCISHLEIKIFARINGDSPFTNSTLLDEAVTKLEKNNELDLVTNLLPRRFPYGLSIEVIRSTSYLRHQVKFTEEKYKEHATSWLYQNLDQINTIKLQYKHDNDHDIRLTVDTKEDHKILESLIQNNPDFDFHLSDVSELVKIFKLNKQITND